MASWTVHAPTGDVATAVAADRLTILREGLSWSALVVPFLWAPWNRLWLVFVGWLAASGVIQAIDGFVSDSLGTLLSFAFLVWFGLAGNDLHRWTLERRGHRLVGLVQADDAIEAEARFVSRLAAAADIDKGAAEAPPTPIRATIARDLPPIVGFADATGGRS